jgi:hypothetical protein
MTRSRDGTGLGLAIAKSLIEGMEGRITLGSKPGEGSIFTITLPVWNPQLLAIAFSLLKMTLNWQSSSNLNLVLKDIMSLSPQMDWMD